HRLDVQDDVDPARVGQDRFQPAGADLGRVAGHREGRGVLLPDAYRPAADLDRVRPAGQDPTGGRWGGLAAKPAEQLHRYSPPSGAPWMTVFSGARPTAGGGAVGARQPARVAAASGPSSTVAVTSHAARARTASLARRMVWPGPRRSRTAMLT